MEVIIFFQDCNSKENLSMPLWSRNSKFSIACKHCMIWANSPLILKDFLVLHGKLLYIDILAYRSFLHFSSSFSSLTAQ